MKALNLIVIITITMSIFSVFLSTKNSVKINLTNQKTIRFIYYKVGIGHSQPKATDPKRTPLLSCWRRGLNYGVTAWEFHVLITNKVMLFPTHQKTIN